MVGNHGRPEREKLSEQRIVAWRLPVDPAQDIRPDGLLVYRARTQSVCCPGHLRDTNGHGSGRHSIEDILDELVAALCLRAAVVKGHMLRQYGVQEFDQFRAALDCVRDL